MLRLGTRGRRTLLVLACAGGVAACGGGSGSTAREDTLPVATIVSDARNALLAVTSVKVHYHWEGDGPTVDQTYVVTPGGSSPAAQPSDCVTLAEFVGMLEFEDMATNKGLQTIAGAQLIQLDHGPDTWDLFVQDARPAYPVSLSYITGHGRATYDFSAFDAPATVTTPSAGCPPPTPTPANTGGSSTTTLSGTVTGTLVGPADCGPDQISARYESGTWAINGEPQPLGPFVGVDLQTGPPYRATVDVNMADDTFDGTVTADHITGTTLHAHFSGVLKGALGSVMVSMDVSCDALPASAVR